ncbi:hypothetical protein AC1031_006886 [Aphanomyces cochlioides]|nr:hypothetical protein AC1031_006886 [Aphanomyces cochlioides]
MSNLSIFEELFWPFKDKFYMGPPTFFLYNLVLTGPPPLVEIENRTAAVAKVKALPISEDVLVAMNAAGGGGPFFMGAGNGNSAMNMNPNMNYNMNFMMSPSNDASQAAMNLQMNSFGTNTGDAATTTGSSSNSTSTGSFNRGNYRCSRCGEPKKGHVCPYQPANYKCNKCGNLKRSCTCGAPQKSNMEVQCALDENMTVAKLDRSAQGVTDFHESIRAFVDGAN